MTIAAQPANSSESIITLEPGRRTGMTALFVVAVVFYAKVLILTIYKMHKTPLQDALKRAFKSKS